MKLKHIALIGSLFPILFSIVLFFGVLISADSDDENSNFSSGITGMNLSAEVLKHQPMVEKYARENGISEYVNVLLAIIQVESGGTAEDVMQSSESLGLPPNSLDTESSIKQGCKYFASLLSSCKNQGIDDLNVAIQSYNYGGGYVGYVAGKGKKHTFNLAESFAREKSGGKKVTYTNPIAVAKNGGWRYGYGNMFYVEVVNQYLAVPHDRVVMLMGGCDSIREVIAFPKVKDASCLMTEAPTPVDPKQLEELGIEVCEETETTEE